MHIVMLVMFAVVSLTLLGVVVLIAKERLRDLGHFINVCVLATFVCGNLISNAVFWTLHVDSLLVPLKEQFRMASATEPRHRYAASDRGSTLDYGGRLDRIVQERDALTKEMGLIGIGVSWHTDGDSVSSVGIYLHAGFLAIFSVPVILLALLVWLTKGSRQAYWRRKDARRPLA